MCTVHMLKAWPRAAGRPSGPSSAQSYQMYRHASGVVTGPVPRGDAGYMEELRTHSDPPVAAVGAVGLRDQYRAADNAVGGRGWPAGNAVGGGRLGLLWPAGDGYGGPGGMAVGNAGGRMHVNNNRGDGYAAAAGGQLGRGQAAGAAAAGGPINVGGQGDDLVDFFYDKFNQWDPVVGITE